METKILRWIRILALVLIAAFSVYNMIQWYYVQKRMLPNMDAHHFVLIMGLPGAFFTSLFLVLLLKQHEKPIEFKAFTIELKGASGEVVLWLLCFLAIVHATHILWNDN